MMSVEFSNFENVFTQVQALTRVPNSHSNRLTFFFARTKQKIKIMKNVDQLRRASYGIDQSNSHSHIHGETNRFFFVLFFYDFSVQLRIRNWSPLKIILFIFFPASSSTASRAVSYATQSRLPVTYDRVACSVSRTRNARVAMHSFRRSFFSSADSSVFSSISVVGSFILFVAVTMAMAIR